jgi:hypothetical protein
MKANTGISNELSADYAEVGLKSQKLLVVHTIF